MPPNTPTASPIDPHNHPAILEELLKHGMDTVPHTGVIHVGAHHGQEVETYLRAGFSRVVLVEPNPACADLLRAQHEKNRKVRVFEEALSDFNGTADFHIHTSRTGSTEPASLLKMKRFKEIVSTLHTPKTLQVPVITLDALFLREKWEATDFSVLNLDTQGSELSILKGAGARLQSFSAVITEVQLIELYENAPLSPELNAFLTNAGFSLRKTLVHEMYDAKGTFPAFAETLYIKNNL